MALSLGVAAVLRRSRLRGHGLALTLAVLAFFGLAFAATATFGAVVAPIGPELWGVSWLSFLVIGLLLAIALAVSSIPVATSEPSPAGVTARAEAIRTTIAIVVWAALAIVAFAAVTRYLG